MSKTELNDKMILIPLKEYKYLKSVVNKIGRKIKSDKDPDFLNPSQLKRIELIDKKVKSSDYSDMIDFEELKKKIQNSRKQNVFLKNRKKSRKIY